MGTPTLPGSGQGAELRGRGVRKERRRGERRGEDRNSFIQQNPQQRARRPPSGSWRGGVRDRVECGRQGDQEQSGERARDPQRLGAGRETGRRIRERERQRDKKSGTDEERGSSPVAQPVKDMPLSLQQLRLLQWGGFDPWPGKFRMLQMPPKYKNSCLMMAFIHVNVWGVLVQMWLSNCMYQQFCLSYCLRI